MAPAATIREPGCMSHHGLRTSPCVKFAFPLKKLESILREKGSRDHPTRRFFNPLPDGQGGIRLANSHATALGNSPFRGSFAAVRTLATVTKFPESELEASMSDISRKDGARSEMITGSFNDRESADRAYESLIARGYTDKEIHVIMSDETRKRLYGKDGRTDKVVEITEGHKTLKGGAVGGMVGGAVGATLLALIATGTSLAVPGIGLLIAGPLAGALAGGATGAAAGGLVGMLVGAGIPEERARLYEKDLKGGAIILGVSPRHADDADYFEREWQAQGQHVYR